MATKAPFVIDPARTRIAVAYMNAGYIADEVLPRIGVGVQDFKYMIYNKKDSFTIPDTKVGRTSRPNEVEFGGTEQTASCVDYGLEDPVPEADISNAPVGYDPLDHATEGTAELILLDREKRVADTVFAAATYPTGNKATLSGTGQWSDYTNSDPIEAILTAFDAMIMRPNIGVLGQATWTKLRMHPDVIKAIGGNSGDKGVAARRAVAELLELEELYIGQAWSNTANRGQTASYARLWGKHAAFLRRDRTANTRRGVTFGMTAQFGNRVASTRPDPDIGLRGGTRVRVGETVKELVIASDAGYLFTNAVA